MGDRRNGVSQPAYDLLLEGGQLQLNESGITA
jgi:hypothetical protein